MSRPPHIIGAAHVIAGATRVIGSIADLDRDCARVAVPRVRTVTWISRVIPRSLPGIAAIIIIGAAAYSDPQRKEKKQEDGPARSGYSTSGGDRLRVINNAHFRIIIYGFEVTFTRPRSGTYSPAPETAAGCGRR